MRTASASAVSERASALFSHFAYLQRREEQYHARPVRERLGVASNVAAAFMRERDSHREWPSLTIPAFLKHVQSVGSKHAHSQEAGP